MSWPIHGSNPKYIYQALGIESPEQYIDFSANINPLGPPESIRENWSYFYEQITVYPDPYSMDLRIKVAKLLNVDKEWILFGNGASELISLIGRMLYQKKVMIIQPAFSEYEGACSVNECEIFYFQLVEPDWRLEVENFKKKVIDVDAVFLCNPSNPTGVYYPLQTIIDIAMECKKNNCLLILDEAFYDYVDGYESMISYLEDYSNVIILRSLTKMYAIPGLRLGYMVANPDIILKIKAFQPHWSVNSVAMLAGELCIDNEVFQEKTKSYILKEKDKLFTYFESEGFDHSPSKTNYYILRDSREEDQMPFFIFLLTKGIVPRHTRNFSGLEGRWLRFAIKGSIENSKLIEALEQWRRHRC
ncbi:threonine-phosphate decarboxylase CobD [Bacillus massilinigeriensis]|uniref:threonine-phosphate decarboxylase CobD n=1 Tax=Bacillus massilionigeriensis TaxID=1805475 RepID=UPI00096B3B73|nr:threonine-phosphate decarboxylase CobD [Bacillus massilionigeriensis]